MTTPRTSPRFGCLIGRDLKDRLGQFIEVTITHADLTAAATSQAVDIGDIPAGAQIRGADIRLATPFTGGSVSACVVDIGDAGDADAIVDGANVLAAAVDGQASTRPLGIAPNKLFDAATTLTATFATTDDNVADLTAGECTIRVLFDVL